MSRYGLMGTTIRSRDVTLDRIRQGLCVMKIVVQAFTSVEDPTMRSAGPERVRVILSQETSIMVFI